jgi:hypothetical protein
MIENKGATDLIQWSSTTSGGGFQSPLLAQAAVFGTRWHSLRNTLQLTV